MTEIKGNGTMAVKEIPVSSFIRLHLSAKGLIELIQSNVEKVVVETDENLTDFFEVVNSGRTLYVNSEGKFKKPVFTKSLIKIYLRQIDTLYIRCDMGDVIGNAPLTMQNPLDIKIQSTGHTSLNIIAPAIKILSQCQGNVVLRGKCLSLEVKNQSEGSFYAKDLATDSLIFKNMSVGDVELFAEKQISIAHYGEGKITYCGNGVLKDVKQYGSGLIKHSDYITE